MTSSSSRSQGLLSEEGEHIAVHEAGHAVVGRKLGLTCGDATVIADDDSAGASICADPWRIAWDWEQRGRFREIAVVMRGRIMTFMAGLEAEIELLGSSRGGDGDDRWQIAQMLDTLADEDVRDRLDERLRAAARMLVRRHRATIQVVADALLAAGTLQADKLDAFCTGFKPIRPG